MSVKTKRPQRVKQIEHHLRNYHTYKVGIKNLKNQLDYIMPSMTATYEVSEGSTGTFNIKSDTERYAIDRIESNKALAIHEDIARYTLIINSIDEALEDLGTLEKDFVESRYIQGNTVSQTSIKMGYSENQTFAIRNQALDKLLITLRGLVQFQ